MADTPTVSLAGIAELRQKADGLRRFILSEGVDALRSRIEAALPAARAAAALVGPLHAGWDAIFDAEALLAGRPTVVADAGALVQMLERLAAAPTTETEHDG